ncbi:hypothetical protein V6N13_117251 [Hibiscus sabdariffa]
MGGFQKKRKETKQFRSHKKKEGGSPSTVVEEWFGEGFHPLFLKFGDPSRKTEPASSALLCRASGTSPVPRREPNLWPILGGPAEP